jgi:SAM-dependent methyltransferase
MSLIERIHGDYVHKRRVRVLRDHLAALIPQNARALDVGCGDGLLDHLMLQKRPDLELRGIDVLVRDQTRIPVDEFDGLVIPHADASFDAVMFVDVLHHTQDPMILLREAVRVARKAIVIKDHTLNGWLAGLTLRFLDWVGNARHGVLLPYNYWPQQRWVGAFGILGLTISVWTQDLKLYPRPANWLFGRSLHFIARLDLS